jgi:hypothetical protein
MQLKNKKNNYKKLLFLLFTTNLLIKKTDTEQQNKQNPNYRIDMIQEIDNILTTNVQSSIEPRQPLHKIPTLQEIQFNTPKHPSIPEEFKNDNGDYHTPSYTFIKELPQTPLPQTKKTTNTAHIEIINLTELAQQPSTIKNPNQSTKPYPLPGYTSTQNKQKQHMNPSKTTQQQNKSQKNTMYYLKSKNIQNKKTTKQQQEDHCYIPIDFQEKKQQITQKENQQTPEKKQSKTKKIFKPAFKIKFNKNNKTKKPKTQTKTKQKRAQQLKIEKEIQKQQKIKQKQQTKQLLLKQKQQKKQAQQALVQQLLKAKQQKQQNKKSLFQKNPITTPQPKTTKPTFQTPTKTSDTDLIKVLLLTDELLGKLPEEVIDDFVQSDDFKLYEKVLSKYKTT